jgi:hypothetical protein
VQSTTSKVANKKEQRIIKNDGVPAARFGYDVRHVPLCLPPGYRLSPFLSGACAPRSTTIILYSLLLRQHRTIPA